MSKTLTLSPAAREARAAARAAPMPASKPIVAPAAGCAPESGSAPITTPEFRSENLSNKAAKKAAMRDLQRRLKAMWPHLFGNDSTPLKVGIKADILPHLTEDERRWLPAVLYQHVHRQAYQQALTQPGAHRCGLDGSLSEITAEQVAHAAKVLSNEYTPQPVEVGKP